MKNKSLIVNAIILIILSGVLIFFTIKQQKPNEVVLTEDCINPTNLIKVSYEGCYNSMSDKIIIYIKRFKDNYLINSINISTNQETFKFNNVPPGT